MYEVNAALNIITLTPCLLKTWLSEYYFIKNLQMYSATSKGFGVILIFRIANKSNK